MKRSSSNCLRVSIGKLFSPKGTAPRQLETKHEHTLSVPYVFRNHLIWGEECAERLKPELNDSARLSGLERRRMRFANQKAVCLCQRCYHRRVLNRYRRYDCDAVRAGR